MSLLLENSKPEGLLVKTIGPVFGHEKKGLTDVVHLVKYQISMEDFLAMSYYVLTNTDLSENDPRLKYLHNVKNLKPTKGYFTMGHPPVPNAKRLAPVPEKDEDGDVLEL